MIKQRLSKLLAASGIASRRACEDLIFSGRVALNGQIVLLPQTKASRDEKITVDGQPIGEDESKVYFMLNKPEGYVCSARASPSTKIVLDLFADCSQRLFTVGRLDKQTKGLLIVTNDGIFANKVIHPSANITKEYLAKTNQEITAEHLKAVSSGTLVEGVFVKPKSVAKVRRGTVKISVAEGKKREVRLLLENAGLEVKELTRIRIGGLHLGSLAEGSRRALTPAEQEAIFN